MTKEGLKESWRVYARNVETAGLQEKNEKGKGKEKENGRKWRRMEEDVDGDAKEELESEVMWWSFVTTRMVTMSMALEKLTEENAELRREIKEMRRENTEDWGDFFKEVREVQKDTRMLEGWMADCGVDRGEGVRIRVWVRIRIE